MTQPETFSKVGSVWLYMKSLMFDVSDTLTCCAATVTSTSVGHSRLPLLLRTKIEDSTGPTNIFVAVHESTYIS